jgi:hypothetical protein
MMPLHSRIMPKHRIDLSCLCGFVDVDFAVPRLLALDLLGQF